MMRRFMNTCAQDHFDVTPQEIVVTTIPFVRSLLVHTNRTWENAIAAWYARKPEDPHMAPAARDVSHDHPIVDSTDTIYMMWNQSIVESTDTVSVESDPVLESRL